MQYACAASRRQLRWRCCARINNGLQIQAQVHKADTSAPASLAAVLRVCTCTGRVPCKRTSQSRCNVCIASARDRLAAEAGFKEQARTVTFLILLDNHAALAVCIAVAGLAGVDLHAHTIHYRCICDSLLRRFVTHTIHLQEGQAPMMCFEIDQADQAQLQGKIQLYSCAASASISCWHCSCARLRACACTMPLPFAAQSTHLSESRLFWQQLAHSWQCVKALEQRQDRLLRTVHEASSSHIESSGCPLHLP